MKFDRLSEYYRPERSSAVYPSMNTSGSLEVFINALAGALAYFRKYDDLRQAMLDEIDRVNEILDQRGSRDYHESVPFLEVRRL